ncbi:hypothetical protein [Piscinibacter gummiphilus]|uniref:Uncharacterized protein n=1 Tax=Piscinibacter gummiphilus TaxID=946333 RepID=A0ABZ0D715_9BURK|nr:hypothetical protein [Piscinibacter gummiphilus]WOB10828.1 hypothetical protein RXV79_12420 [Piscinibacter gummiphilus]
MDLSIDEIYARLTRGVGRELVNDDNVFALIERAERDRHAILATELREWQAPCSSVQQVPSTIAPTRGFNRENVKH